ncbi:30S ribosomal protein S3 [bacterium]|nr:30S ribosomal protein S3 [bacterium]MBU3955742.1 30S ribosomal protein S3 [bacterium]MBU4133911.1 30S ribosomal protein S3 [bacterium]
MGQKIHPYGVRIGINRNWVSRWFVKRGAAESIMEDVKIRKTIESKLGRSQISKVEIEKASNQIVITVHTARPGLVIGQKGVTIDALREDIALAIGKEVKINVAEIKQPFLDAQIVSEMVAVQLEKKMPFRSVCKRMIKNIMSEGALGAKVMVAGRLGGNEIARKEWFKDGSVPLQSLAKNIDYGFSKTYTKYGIIGVKSWVHKKDEISRTAVKTGAVVEASDESAAPVSEGAVLGAAPIAKVLKVKVADVAKEDD